uniref:LptA/OstA family protein n=1 Tax=Candidatus Cyanaurora vandensis TaxID=2714958 RepID=UPI00258019A9
MPVPLPPPPPAEVRPVAANDLRADNQRAAELQGKTVDLKQQEILIPVGGAAGENLRLQADTQQYTFEEERFVARGNVRMDFRESYLLADELQVDLKTRIAIAVGNIRLVRGAQEVTGERIEYNFALEEGALYQAKGILNTQTLTQLEAPSPLANDPAPPPAGGQVLP